MKKKSVRIILVLGFFITTTIMIAYIARTIILLKEKPAIISIFDGERAYEDVKFQISLGPRIPDSHAKDNFIDWIVGDLQSSKWSVEVSNNVQMEHSVNNIIARWGTGRPWIILGAHYDSRIMADKDPHREHRILAVPGANDGASGVAVLVELSRILPQLLSNTDLRLNTPSQVGLVFFDAEDNGNLPGWDWILGSRAFVDNLNEFPDAVVIIDMVGDADLNICKEQNSNKDITSEIWKIAAEKGYSKIFSSRCSYTILDDHVPFVDAGIPAIVIIDFNYPYHHTIEDTPDKVSAESMKIVGDILLTWVINYHWQK
jgi:glutaminyl-peptide cyclotransferase